MIAINASKTIGSLVGRSRPGCKARQAVHVSAASWPIAMAVGRRIVENRSSLGELFASNASTVQAPSSRREVR
ncbi:hypothetical protein ABQJ54_05395 [Rhodanobacter sp. Si-c]|uniref:Uncharacterized protein n=1 Tax=Rhodanobacter lycopersici TaxID=3162487 RepID=A0ABV3QBG2_9GAMM